MASTPQSDRRLQIRDSALRARAPRGQIGYAQVIANQGSITGIVDLTGLSVIVNVGAERRIKVTGHVRSWASTVVNDRVQFAIREGGTTLNEIVAAMDPSAGDANGGGQVVWVITPSAGVHTYKLSANAVDGGTVTMHASATFPAFILVEDIGAA